MKNMNSDSNISDKLDSINFNDQKGIVVPVILWWLGAPITLLLVLWFLGIL